MLSHLSSSSTYARALRLSALCLAVLFGLGATAFSGPEVDRTTRVATTQLRETAATYQVSVGLDGEIYPAFANYASLRQVRNRSWGTVAVKITNSTSQLLRNRVTVQVPGWSDQEIQLVELDAGESHTYLFAPTFLPRFYQNREIVAATADVTVTDAAGKVVHQETLPVRIRSVDDLYWGRDFEYASFIASWVTPHDPAVEKLLARAKEFTPGRRLPGYESKGPAADERSTIMQAKAIYRALQEQGVSYVKSSMTLGRHEEVSERVRMPAESIGQSSANCIDGAVMYAAMFENLGMEPSIVLVPGHAYVGVRLSRLSNKYLYIETSLTGRASFETAVASAKRSMSKFPKPEVISISIRQARLDGIYPMPFGDPVVHGLTLEAGKAGPRSGS